MVVFGMPLSPQNFWDWDHTVRKHFQNIVKVNDERRDKGFTEILIRSGNKVKLKWDGKTPFSTQ
jgi:hypothetical protein